MKKEVLFALFLVFILFFSNLASAYSYSITARVVDDIRMFFAGDEGKVDIALEVREKQIDEAIEKAKAGDTEEAIKILEDAKKKLETVQEKTSSDSADKVKTNVEEITEKIMQSKDINPEFASYLEEHLTEEQKTALSAELSDKLFTYCDELAKQDYELMLEDEKCNPDNVPAWLKRDIEKKMEEYQKEAAEKMIEQLTVCINDPRECDCSEIPISSEKAKCEKSKALAIRCEFQKDESACRQLGEMKPEMPSNMPKFLRPIFQKTVDDLIKNKEKEMFSKFAPSECIEAGVKTREECEAIMMEKYAPKECIEAGATTKEECEKIMFAIHGPPPTECMENGEFIGPEACEEKMVKSGKIPQECIKDGKPIPREECEQVMKEKGMGPPPECVENGEFIGEEECQRIMQEKGMMGPPPECEGLSKEECEEIMEERGIMPRMEPEMKMEKEMMIGKKEFKIPQECVGMTFQECESYLMGKHMPQDCVEAGALTPEACKRIMLPEECKQAGALNPNECEAIMIKKQMPKECQDAGALSPEKCAKIMAGNIVMASPGSEIDFLRKKGISQDKIPDVCMQGSNFVRSMECDEALAEIGITLPPPTDISNIPKECIIDGTPISPQECETILQGKIMNENIPGPCREAGITNPEECGRFMEKEKRKAGMGMADLPPECFGKSVQECKEIMDSLGMEPIDVMGIMYGKIEEGEPEKKPQEKHKEIPRECAEMGITDKAACEIVMSKINEERIKNGDKMIVDKEGNENYITNDEINKIADEAEKKAEELKPDLEQAEEIRGEITDIEGKIVELEELKEFEKEIPEIEEHEEAPKPEEQEGLTPELQPSPESAPEPSPEPSPEPAPESPPTGEVIKEIPKENFLTRFLDRIFG